MCINGATCLCMYTKLACYYHVVRIHSKLFIAHWTHFTRVCDAKFDRTETNASVKDDDELMLNVLRCWLTY